MGVRDVAKAIGAGALALLANLLVTTIAIVVYAQFLNPGHPGSYYDAMAPQIARFTAPPGGLVFLFTAAYMLSRYREDDDAFKLVIVAYLAYGLIDVALGLGDSGMASLNWTLAFSLLLALSGSLLGWYFTKRV